MPLFPSAGLQLVATTGVSGFALQNATPTVLTWTVPNDSAMHRVQVMAALIVTSPTTGGQVNIVFKDPAGGSQTFTLYTASQGSGGYKTPSQTELLLQANSTVTISQATAMTAGTATLFAELWAS